jgi:hypothetical protein
MRSGKTGGGGPMQKTPIAADPDDYVANLRGWQRECVGALRSAVRAAATLDEGIKWGHIVYQSAGPVCLIRAEAHRVLFGFWRGQRLRDIEPRLEPGGKYEMATLELREDSDASPDVMRRLVREAVKLNATLGDPTDIAAPRAASRKRTVPATGRRRNEQQ